MTRSRRAPRIAEVLRAAFQLEAVLLLVLAVVASGAVLGYRGASTQARDGQDALLRLETLRAELLSAETALRGYALVGKLEFLEPYVIAFPRLEEAVDDLERSVSDADRPVLRQIAANARSWQDDFATVVLARLRDDREGALALIRSGAGKRRVDRVRELVARLERSTRDEVDDARRMADRVGRLGLILAGATLIGLLATAGATRHRLRVGVADPLMALAGTASRFGAGQLGVRSDAVGVAELRRVVDAFNTMADRIEETVVGLRTVDRMKSEFVAVVSHELRTPLTSIRGSLGLLASGAMGPLPEGSGEMLDVAIANTDRLVRLINDILDLERIEGGREVLVRTRWPAEDVLREVADSLAAVADAAGVHFLVKPGRVIVDADRDRIVQALTNLAANAVKFSGRGTDVRLIAEEGAGWVALRVVDEGRGVPADRLETIFERFAQVDSSDAREKGGTGLGLAIVRSIAELHGGRVDVVSEVGVGSGFSLVLPTPATTDPSEDPWPAGGPGR